MIKERGFSVEEEDELKKREVTEYENAADCKGIRIRLERNVNPVNDLQIRDIVSTKKCVSMLSSSNVKENFLRYMCSSF